MSTRRRFSGDFKAMAALEALRGDKTNPARNTAGPGRAHSARGRNAATRAVSTAGVPGPCMTQDCRMDRRRLI